MFAGFTASSPRILGLCCFYGVSGLQVLGGFKISYGI